MNENIMNPIPYAILELVRKTVSEIPFDVIQQVAEILAQPSADCSLLQRRALGLIGNPNFRQYLADLFRAWTLDAPELSGSSLAVALLSAAHVLQYQVGNQTVELLWTGPDVKRVPLRRTDQALLELIRGSHSSLIVVSFAVYRHEPLIEALRKAAERGVNVRLVLESAEESEGKVSYDMIGAMIKALPPDVKVYVWPLEKRTKDEEGHHGSLHAKCAVADGCALFISSANLTEYAFALNMELGVLLRGGSSPATVESHFTGLIESGILSRI